VSVAEDPITPAYGTTRNRRATVTYREFERAATTLLAAGEKPGLENVREALGGGSPETIRQMLRRYWSDLAAQVRSPAQALQRLPTEVADLAEELWQRSLGLAAQKAAHDDNAALERLEQLKRENEIRSHALGVKERTLREQEGSREKTLKELQEHVATLVSIVSRNSETISALQAGKADAESQAEMYRQQLAQVIARAVVRNQKAGTRPTKGKPAARKSPRKHKPKRAARKATHVKAATRKRKRR
jgi:hypothetical protein